MTRSSFTPHPVTWDDERIARFWDFMSTRTAAGEYFSAKIAPALVRLMERRIRRLGTILDVGCGNGDLLAELQARGHRILGVDSSPASVERARARLGGDPDRVQLASPGELPVANESVDTILFVEVFEHVLDEALSQMLAEARRVVRPGGHLLVTTPNREDLSVDAVQCPDCGAEFHRMQHVRSWTATTLRAALEAGGFTPAATLALRLPERSRLPLRLARLAWYRVRRDRRNLVAIARRR